MALDLVGHPCGPTSVLRRVYRDDTGRADWALAGGHHSNVLKWFGPDRPDDRTVIGEEERLRPLGGRACLSLASVKKLSRGSLPSKAEFCMAFDLEVPDGIYLVRGPRGWGELPIPDGDYGPSELWRLLSSAVRSGDPSKVDFAGSVLQTLGFEWR